MTPATFASKTSAIEDDTADNSVGNVTGSNAVNVFLGIGIAWTMAAVYWEAQGEKFIVPVGRFVTDLMSRLSLILIFPLQSGILCHRLLYRSHPRCPHPAGQKTSRCWRRAGWTQALQDNLIIALRLLLGVLCYDLRPGSLWCD